MGLLESYLQYRKKLRQDFLGYISGLLDEEIVRRLDGQRQHFKYTRLRHSVDVAYRSYYLARLLRWRNSGSVARAALLHDLFFHEEGGNNFRMIFEHPKVALENARTITSLTPLEEDIIRKHMFLLTFSLPSYKESYLVTLVDKISAASEFCISVFSRKKLYTAFEEAGVATAFLLLPAPNIG